MFQRSSLPVSPGIITLMTEAIRISEKLEKFYQTTRRYNPEGYYYLVEERGSFLGGVKTGSQVP
jgi:hypothetical protein